MIRFGPSGNSESFYAAGFSHTEESAAFVKERGLDCFEYSFGRGVRMSEEKAASIGEAFRTAGVEISVHAHYFVNFANPDDEMAAKSYGYVLDSGKMAKLMGGNRVVFHPAAQGKAGRGEAVEKTEDRLKILRDYIYLNDLQDMKFCPETMGKLAQIGTVEEIVRFCKIDPVFTPCVDFGHINAREQGSLKTVDDYLSNGIARVILGSAALKNPAFVQQAVQKYGERIAVGIDAKNGRVAAEGWLDDSNVDYIELAKAMEQIGVKYMIFTDISKDGTLSGPNLEQLRMLQDAVSCEIIASGGICDIGDIRALKELGVYGAICGKSLYRGTLDLAQAIRVGAE